MLLSIAGGLQTDYPEVILRTSWKVSFSVTSPMSREPGAGQVTANPVSRVTLTVSSAWKRW